MRGTLADPSLARYAGRFVWLALDYDKPENQDFLVRHQATWTPTFYILDPSTDRAVATQIGAMTLSEVTRFLERGARGMTAPPPASPAGVALAHGDELLATDKRSDAAAAYEQALTLADPAWPDRARAVGAYTSTLMQLDRYQPCAETAAAEAPRMARDEMFGRVVVTGLSCANQASEPWTGPAKAVLEPLAMEALTVPSTVRDHRFWLYDELMTAARTRGEAATVTKLGGRWLDEIAAIKPANDDERLALDISRIEAAKALGDPSRVLPALVAAERAHPDNYFLSLRLAQLEVDAKRYSDAIAACDRTLSHVTGPVGTSWLLRIKADALVGLDRKGDARTILEQALAAARQIGLPSARERSIARVTAALQKLPAN